MTCKRAGLIGGTLSLDPDNRQVLLPVIPFAGSQPGDHPVAKVACIAHPAA